VNSRFPPSKSVEMQSSVDSCEKKHTHTEAFSHAGGVSHLHGEQRVHDLVEQSFLRNASARASLGKPAPDAWDRAVLTSQ
jgi:hypothetical protein